MKSMVWTGENGWELRIESDGDNVTITVPNGNVAVKELQHEVALAWNEFGSKLELHLGEQTT